jgi:terminase small subunit / prophage DNA-packing protein
MTKCTQAEFGEHVGVSQPTVSELCQRGIIPRDDKGKLDLDEARLAYCAHLRSVASGRSGNIEVDLDITEQRARKAKEEADKLEMQNAQLRGELLAREDVDAAVVSAFARVRARLIGVPSKVAPLVVVMDNPAEIEGSIRKAIYEALKELADTSVTDLCGDYGDMVEDSGAAAGPDGEPVGGRLPETEP